MKNTLLFFAILIASITLSVNVVAQTYVINEIYATDYVQPPTVPATLTPNANCEITSAPAWGTGYTSCAHTTSSAGGATLSFGTPLALVSNGTNEGTITVYWGSVSNRPLNLTINGGAATQIDAITTSTERNVVRTATYAIPIGTTSISSLTLSGAGGSNSYYFEIKVETWVLAGPRIETFSLAISTDPLATEYPADNIDVDGTGVGHIHVIVPYAVWRDNITNLYPTITANAITTFVTPADPTAPQNFTNPFTYSLTGGATNRDYIVTVDKIPASTACNILTFNIPSQIGASQFIPAVGLAKDSIIVTMPFSTTPAQIASLIPTYTTSPLVSGKNPNTGVANDFTSPTSYTITAEDGVTTKTYWVRVKKAPASTACSITDFSMGFAKEIVDINQGAGTIKVTVDDSEIITSVSPDITKSDLSSISPVGAQNFIGPIVYTVTAEDGLAQKIYTVTVFPDGAAPLLDSSNPVDDPAFSNPIVSLAGVITLTYNEDVVAGAGAVSISGGGILGSPSYIGKTVQIPFSGLTSLTNYTLTIPAGVFTDYFGNPVAAESIAFRTADGVNKVFPYASKMDGASFPQPPFIAGAPYNVTADSKATTTTQYGAYVLAPGQSLTITTLKAGTVYANVYAPGQNRTFEITDDKSLLPATPGSITDYDNNGTSIQRTINSNTTTVITITNSLTSSGDIYIPYIYISDYNVATIETEKEKWCTKN